SSPPPPGLSPLPLPDALPTSRPYGVIALESAADPTTAPGPAWLAHVASAALGAQSRAAEARRRARHLSALAEFARAAVSASNVAESVHALARLAAQALNTPHAAVFRLRTSGELGLELSHGPAGTRDAQARSLMPAAQEALRAQRTLTGAGGGSLPGPALDGAADVSVWAFRPLVAYEQPFGVLAVWDGPERHPASPEWERGDLETLAALGDHAALLLEH